jgi:putative membrane protein
MTQEASLRGTSDRTFWIVNAIVSAAALAFLAYILLLRNADAQSAEKVAFLPAVNACLNGTSAVLLAAGWVNIKKKRIDAHKRCVVGAFAASSLFLVSYLVYHFLHGSTRWQGTGPLRTTYLAVLASHTLLSVPVVPGALGAFWFAWKKNFRVHTRITKWLMPVWLYVSVTGVLVYALLHGFGMNG